MSDSKNLLTKLPPPSELPSFVQASSNEAKKSLDIAEPAAAVVTTEEPSGQDQPQTTPLEASPESDLPSIQDISNALSPLVKNSVFYSWVKDTIRSVSKVGVEKAKASIDKVVTTLDPQMSALIVS